MRTGIVGYLGLSLWNVQGTVCAVALVGTDAFGLVAALRKLW